MGRIEFRNYRYRQSLTDQLQAKSMYDQAEIIQINLRSTLSMLTIIASQIER